MSGAKFDREYFERESENLRRQCAARRAQRANKPPPEKLPTHPEIRPRQPNERFRFILRSCDDPGEACILWPFKTKDGYGIYAGRTAHAVAYEVWSGTLQPEGMDAAHSCGVRACINPRHISWKTRAENNRDKIEHGTWGRYFTPEDVALIRQSTLSTSEIAALLGASKSAVRDARAGRTWAWVPTPSARLGAGR